MNRKVLKDYDAMVVGEMSGGLDFYEAMKYFAKDRKELLMVFHFAHLKVVRETPFFMAVTILILVRTKD
jgi:glycosidase